MKIESKNHSFSNYPIKIKFYVEGKLNKWLKDEDMAWKDLSFHVKKHKMDKIVEREMTKDAFGLVITDLSHVVNFDGNFIKHGNRPLSKGVILKPFISKEPLNNFQKVCNQ